MQSYLINSFDWSFPPEQPLLAGGDPQCLSASLLTHWIHSSWGAARATNSLASAPGQLHMRGSFSIIFHLAPSLCLRLAQGGHSGTNKCAPKVRWSFDGPSSTKAPPKSVVLSRLAVWLKEVTKWTSKHNLSAFKFERAPHSPAVLAAVAVVPQDASRPQSSAASAAGRPPRPATTRATIASDPLLIVVFYSFIFCCFIIFLFVPSFTAFTSINLHCPFVQIRHSDNVIIVCSFNQHLQPSSTNQTRTNKLTKNVATKIYLLLLLHCR